MKKIKENITKWTYKMASENDIILYQIFNFLSNKQVVNW